MGAQHYVNVCVITAVLVNVILHTSQEYGRSPIYKRTCSKGSLFSQCLSEHITAIWAITNM